MNKKILIKAMATVLLATGLPFFVCAQTAITPNGVTQAPAGTATVNPLPAAYPDNPSSNPVVNMIREWDATYAVSDPGVIVATSRGVDQVKQTSQYFDGLGRPIQTVVKKIVGSNRDLVTPVLYDEFGRETYKYLPYASATNGNGEFKTDPFSDQADFMSTYDPTENEQYYYGRTEYEASPLNRVTATYAPGNSWVGQNRGVTISYDIATKDGDKVHIWNIAFTGDAVPVEGGLYDDGQLYKNITTDENGGQVIEYKDKESHIILKKVASSTSHSGPYDNWLCTYYVYDDLGNLRFVIPPKAVNYLAGNSWALDATTWSSSTIAQNLCFSYEYDERQRMVIKRVPNGGETDMVYDSRDRLIMVQDALQKAQGKWLVTYYDGLNRAVETGLYASAGSRAVQQGNVGTNLHYPSDANASNYTTLTQTFYDNYQWISDNSVSLSPTLITKNLTNSNYFYTPDDATFPYPQAIKATYQNKNMVTGTMTQVLGSDPVQYLYSVNFYDKKGRLIQTQSMNYSNPGTVIRDTITTQYSFSGQVLRTLIAHKRGGVKAQNIRLCTKNTYDNQGHLSQVSKLVGNQFTTAPENIIAKYYYNSLGMLATKDLGQQVDGTASSYSYLTTPVDILKYSYNIRGWLQGINKDYARSSSATAWFGMELNYDYGFTQSQYNGNIAGETWRSRGDGQQRAYGFDYDPANRLKYADYNQNSSGTWDKTKTDFTVSNLAYDANGNITGMNQVGMNLNAITQLDQLQYNYFSNSNQLRYVHD
ncbi:MAG: hypothetical protein JST36_00325, partial [Bacteroidetes bacterium]|nr:hypothetical protein [Bacteroidota bacterium]